MTAPLSGKALLQVRGLVVEHPAPGRRRGATVRAVSGVDLDLAAGECLGLVGESGCGKSSLARAVLQLGVRPTAGSVTLAGTELTGLDRAGLRRLRARLQFVPQDPGDALDPRWTVGACVAEPLLVHRRPRGRDVVADALAQVGLSPSLARRYPHELSGGQRQRVAIARALVLRPDVVVLDEPLTALDVSVQAGVLRLLADLNRDLGVAILLIAHDLGVVRQVCHRVAVMYLGRLAEVGPTGDLFDAPRHPYTRALLAAAPDPWRPFDTGPGIAGGEPPSASDPPPGCRFHPRCPLATAVCAEQTPPLRPLDDGPGGGHQVACHHA